MLKFGQKLKDMMNYKNRDKIISQIEEIVFSDSEDGDGK